jgi:hypothetical protein
MMELEGLQEVDAEVKSLGARIVALTPELERYTRSVHKKLNLTFDYHQKASRYRSGKNS